MENTGKTTILKTGFKHSFWVANIMELFERIAYYGQAAILSIFLRNHLKFDEVSAGQLASIFGGLIYFLPIFAGALADRYGFRKSFSFAFFILAIGYFLIGSTGMTAFASLYSGFDLYWLLVVILVFTSIGGSFIKPSVLGTVAFTTTAESKSLGYAIYYWLVNIGGATGPIIAYFVRDSIGIQYVYLVSAASCGLMLVSTLIFYKEPIKPIIERGKFYTAVKNLLLVLTKFRFMIFLLIYSLYWIMFWQIYVVIPFYVTDFISADAPFEIIISVDALGIIALQLIINRLTKNIPSIYAIILGIFISSLSWILIILHPSIPVIIAAILVISIGEMTQAPRYYEYIADLAPKGQIALFQGYAFLPIAIGWTFGGTLGGVIYKEFARNTQHPETMFLILTCLGILCSVLMFIYNFYTKTKKQ